MSDAPVPPPPSMDAMAAWAAAEAAADAAAERGLVEAAATAPAAPIPAPRPPSKGSSRGRRARQLLSAVAVAGCAIGGAFGSKALFAKARPPEVAAEAPADPAAAPPKPLPSELGARGRVDVLIRAGCYAEALQACREAPRDTFGGESPTAYREALCLEGLGKVREADRAYQKAEKDANVGGWARAALGRARCAIASGSLPAARALADRVLLRSGHPECRVLPRADHPEYRATRFYEEALHVRAQVAVLEAGGSPAVDPLDPGALAWPPLQVTPDKYRDWLPLDVADASPNPDAERDLVQVHRDKDPKRPEVTLRLTKRPAMDVLRALAGAAELELLADDNVAPRLAEAAGPVEVERVPLDGVLSALADRAGVAWAVKDGALHLTRAPRGGDPDAAPGALRRVLAAAPDHPSAGAARVALANLDARAGRFTAAALAYKQVLESPGNAPEVSHAAYNLGLLELKDGNRSSARARFLEVIDRSPNTVFADTSWCWIARTYLDGDDTVSARQAYRTAFDGGTKEAASAGALGILACDLLTGKDESARALLADARFSTREPHALLVTFYTALLRHRVAPTDSRRELLLTALRAADEARGLGPGGVYLAGRVYLELGLPHQMTALYESAVETARGPLALRMLLDTAERYDRLDQRKLARTRYLAVAAADPAELGGLAELKLAGLEARDGHGAEAVRRCQALVTRPGVPRAELLRVMGHGYELQKMYGAAAQCFAGRLPE